MTLDLRGHRSPQLVVDEGNNIFEVTETHICGRPHDFLSCMSRKKSGHMVTIIQDEPGMYTNLQVTNYTKSVYSLKRLQIKKKGTKSQLNDV